MFIVACCLLLFLQLLLKQTHEADAFRGRIDNIAHRQI